MPGHRTHNGCSGQASEQSYSSLLVDLPTLYAVLTEVQECMQTDVLPT